MTFDFDKAINRRNTDCIKYDGGLRRGKPEGLLPLWVADMDFQAPPCVLDALAERVAHGAFGYSESGAAYTDTLVDWFARRAGWRVSAEWLVQSPGVVFALYVAVRAYTRPGEAVMIQQPVYAPFTAAVLANGRQLVVNPLAQNADGRWEMDFDRFEAQIKEHAVKLFILCNPHNPVGRVWTEEELTRVGKICAANGVTVVSDEIHQDFVYAPHRHIVFADLDKSFADITMTCTAPTKTFNLAGLQIANIFIPNEALRERFTAEHRQSGYSQLNALGLVACQAAYAGGAAWVDALLDYLRGNVTFMSAFLRERLPSVRFRAPEGTYLAWLDCAALNMQDDTLNRRVTDDAKLWLEPGAKFGAGGAGFLRLNFAAPRATIAEALERLANALAYGND